MNETPKQMPVLPLSYFPPVHWFAAIAQHQEIMIEVQQRYERQQMFNRSHILTANGPITLSIPIQKDRPEVRLQQKRISYQAHWQRDHWRSIKTAYTNSPYFQYYDYKFQPLFEEESSNLSEFNLRIIRLLLDLLGWEKSIILTQNFQAKGSYSHDLRFDFDPRGKQIPAWFKPQAYGQVFGHEFVAGLSILDLIFNEGPEAIRFLG